MSEKPRILGVDDSLTIRKALELVLVPMGYVLQLAASGAEAVEKARSFQPAAILLDFILPDMRGTEVCRRLAADPETASIPVVLISAKGAEIRQAYQDIGNVVTYIAKPFTPEAILDVVTDVVARSRAGGLAKLQSPGVGDLAREVEDGAVAEAAWEPFREMIAAPAADGEPVGEERERPVAAPPAGNGHAAGGVESSDAFEAEVWDEADDGADEEIAAAAAPLPDDGPRRQSLEVMFEALGAGLEGVYVEEMDTPAGAAADEAKSYMDLVAQLALQLKETLAHARSGTRYALCSDGSVRSLDDGLFDAYRRVCRLLFRAAAGGAVQDLAQDNAARLLVVCHRDSELFGPLSGVAARRDGFQALLVSERFRQLPMMTRLYGPTHLIVDATAHGKALWDQLALVRAMPEGRRLRVAGVAPTATPEQDAAAGRDVRTLFAAGPDLSADVGRWIRNETGTPSSLPAGAASGDVAAAVGL